MGKDLENNCEYAEPFSKKTEEPYKCLREGDCRHKHKLSDEENYCGNDGKALSLD